MAKERTEKSRFQSKYTEGYVGDSQYLAEFMCERIAQKEKKILPFKFWNTPEWKKVFGHQVTAAAKLLKDYSISEILSALRSQRGSLIYSLGMAKVIREIIASEKKKTTITKTDRVIGQCSSDEKPTHIPSARKNILKDLS